MITGSFVFSIFSILMERQVESDRPLSGYYLPAGAASLAVEAML
jgi:hypothetical protein